MPIAAANVNADSQDERLARAQPDAARVWHLISGEFPPQPGGVSDYTRELSTRLTAAHRLLHVWCPHPPEWAAAADGGVSSGVTVHRSLGHWALRDLRRTGELLDQLPAPRRLLVQWVPHAFGLRSVNVPFCAWLRGRAAKGDRVELMVHEPFMPFSARSPTITAAALLQRIMITLLLSAAERVWVSTPAWIGLLRPYALGRSIPFECLPVPSNVPVVGDEDRVAKVRSTYAAENGPLVGHFGTYGEHIMDALGVAIPALLEAVPSAAVLLIGRGSVEARDALLAGPGASFGGRIAACGGLPAPELSAHLSACDVLLQPYPDGVSTRRSSAMAALAHGRAMVTNAGAFTEPLWSESDAVGLAPSGDSAALVGKLLQVVQDRTERERLARAGRVLYEERFDWPHTVARLLFAT